MSGTTGAMMAGLEKFMFEHDFDTESVPPAGTAPDSSGVNEPEAPAEPEEPPAVHTDADLEAARTESYQAGQDAGQKQGYEQGRKEAQTEAENATQQALSQAAEGMERLCRDLDATEARRDAEARDLALTIVRRLFPHLQQTHGMAEIEAVITETLSRLRHHPKVVIRGAPETIARLSERQDALAAQTGFEGRLRLLDDDGVSAGDIRVEWSDGGARRDTESLWREIETAIGDAFGDDARSYGESGANAPPQDSAPDELDDANTSDTPSNATGTAQDADAGAQSTKPSDGRASAETIRSTA